MLNCNNVYYLVICGEKKCQIYNENGSKLLTFIESPDTFTTAAVTSQTAEFEFIVVATDKGEIWSVQPIEGQFAKQTCF